MKKKSVKAYICGTDWSIEAFQAPTMPEFYKTMAQLKRARTCWKYCGIYEVEIKFAKVKQKAKEDEQL